MREQSNFESDSFEYDPEIDELEEVGAFFDPPQGSASVSRETGHGRGGCSCQREAAGSLDELDSELALSMPGWLNPLYRLFKAGRLGWKAGRWIDKKTGQVLGKPISEWGGDFLYRKLGRSRRLEDFYDSLPGPLKRWLNSL
jgi:hypothetical protein